MTTSKAPTVLLIFDMEGVTGIEEVDAVSSGSALYTAGRACLTEDVNAAIRGLKEGGAGAIWVQDGHGSGNAAEPDIIVSDLDGRATVDVRRSAYTPYTTGIDASFDAIVLIGMHAGPDQDGFMAHLHAPEAVRYTVNGVDCTETHLYAASAGRWGIPLLLVTGDDVLESRVTVDFPGLEYVRVKKACGRSRAESLPPSDAHRLIEAGCVRGMRSYMAGRTRPLYFPGPYRFEIEWQNHQQAEGAARHPAVSREGEKSITYTSSDLAEGIDTSLRLFTLAWDGGAVLRRMLSETEEGVQLLQRWRTAMLARMLRSDAAPSFVQPPSRRSADNGHCFGLR
ncbi:MAG: M55 family metallopeptidase [Vicinamibacterales bacterium]|jgi:D-amino peptidase